MCIGIQQWAEKLIRSDWPASHCSQFIKKNVAQIAFNIQRFFSFQSLYWANFANISIYHKPNHLSIVNIDANLIEPCKTKFASLNQHCHSVIDYSYSNHSISMIILILWKILNIKLNDKLSRLNGFCPILSNLSTLAMNWHLLIFKDWTNFISPFPLYYDCRFKLLMWTTTSPHQYLNEYSVSTWNKCWWIERPGSAVFHLLEKQIVWMSVNSNGTFTWSDQSTWFVVQFVIRGIINENWICYFCESLSLLCLSN